jgi:hypothetical protein
VIDDECWKQVWAEITDSESEGRLFMYLERKPKMPSTHWPDWPSPGNCSRHVTGAGISYNQNCRNGRVWKAAIIPFLVAGLNVGRMLANSRSGKLSSGT